MSWNIVTYKNLSRKWTFATTDSGRRFLENHMLSTHNAHVVINIFTKAIALKAYSQEQSTELAVSLNVGQRKIKILSSEAAEVCEMLLEQHQVGEWFTFPTIDFTVLLSPSDYKEIFKFAAELEEEDRELFTKY